MKKRFGRLVIMATTMAAIAIFSFSSSATTSTIYVQAGSTGSSSTITVSGSNKSSFNVAMNYYCFDGYATNVSPSGSTIIRVTPYKSVMNGDAAYLIQASATIGFQCSASPYTWIESIPLINNCGQVGDKILIKSNSNNSSYGYTAQFSWSLS